MKIVIDPGFQTPEDICEYMVKMIPKNASVVLEPTPGLKKLYNAIERKGFKVYAPEDFFLMDRFRFDCIVMNPPFSSHTAFLDNAPKDINLKGMKAGYYILEKCMEMSDNIIALMPWFTIGDSDVRMRKLIDFGLVSITPLPRKTFEYARIQTVIIQLSKGYNKKTIFKTELINNQILEK